MRLAAAMMLGALAACGPTMVPGGSPGAPGDDAGEDAQARPQGHEGDALAPLVGEAGVAPEDGGSEAGPMAFTDPCDLMQVEDPDAGAATPTIVYAEHAFPGKTASQLASVIALGNIAPGPYAWAPPNATQVQLAAYVGDGYVAASCGGLYEGLDSGTLYYSSVTFVLP